MKKMLRKPENWQDFESLCKKLWGEIWLCSEIKKNGRNGQTQNGVDVYGVPKGENRYYGIQCKGKDDYTKAQLTKSEIDAELEKATTFEPRLGKFYFATTANKDAGIETYIRQKDIEYREKELFEIHLFSWEDIVDLIEENKLTFDWYVKNIDHKSIYSIKIEFNDSSSHLDCFPSLIRNHITYTTKTFTNPDKSSTSGLLALAMPTISIPSQNNDRDSIKLEPQPRRFYMHDRQTINKSSSVFSIRITNNGNTQIENYKMYFGFKDDRISMDIVDKSDSFLDFTKYSYNTFKYEDLNEGVLDPKSKVLVQSDSIRTDDICIRPLVEEPLHLNLWWRFVCKDFNESGEMTITLNTVIKDRFTTEESILGGEPVVRLENDFELVR